jgi:cation transport ATPase
MLLERERMEQVVQKLSADALALRESTQHEAQKVAEVTASKAELEQKVQTISGELQAVSHQALDTASKYQREIEQIRQDSQQERERNRELLERLERNQKEQQAQIVRQRKLFFIGFTWVACVIALVTLRPWEWDGDLKWITLTICVIAASITQAVAFYQRAMHRYIGAALVAINVIALAMTILLPFGISISETWGMIVGAANIIAAAYAAFALLPSSKL